MKLLICTLLFLIITNVTSHDVYIVYMGGKGTSKSGSLREDQARLINSVQNRTALLHVYKHGFTGFAVHASEEEAKLLAAQPGVLSVFRDKTVPLHTTRSWTFLEHQHDSLSATSHSGSTANGSDIIIGVIDSGIWPESKSFADEGMGPVPERWRGTCEETKDFPASSCNRKIIGARNFDKLNQTCRDFFGHGSHTASTAAGAAVFGVSYYGLAAGTAIGGSPNSRIAVYRACGQPLGCYGSAILAAMDAAIHDGVDIMSLSLGEADTDIRIDPVAIGGFHAIEHGIMVVCSAGNLGPTNSSVVNSAPWLTTVGASSIDRQFVASVVLGNNQVIKGSAIQFSHLCESPIYPLIDGVLAKINGSKDSASRNCESGSIDFSKIKGKILVCFDQDKGGSFKALEIIDKGGIGVIFISDDMNIAPSNDYLNVTHPISAVGFEDGYEILSYMHAYRNPTATILKSETMLSYKPAPIIADFSSRGPQALAPNILKPDITAPGVNIIAAWSKVESDSAIPGKELPDYIFASGTSMSCPHISGVAALVKSQHPTWDHSAIRSAIMTTAVQKNSVGAPIRKLPGLQKATPYDFGAGEVNTAQVTNPGLVYETTAIDYYNFLCNYGYNLSTIRLIAKDIPRGFSCPKDADADLISNMNYPSIAVSKFKHGTKRMVTRTVTNVGDEEDTVYTVTVDPPASRYLKVQVMPKKLHFTKENKKHSFKVIFSTDYPYESPVFGWITWSNDQYRVRSPFVLNIN
ncbi:CO(2)-response secreted protease [Daucus carota subsp. sativus]|uniref:CO(2)-response secreted protease n=1 Tax=Daucus carota subsp. sativus TaxID=79200 RepID=UPI0007EF4427|nr:PREDICTED: CO(2)-response secreted protease-like [Daucus carota subsp. sativus]